MTTGVGVESRHGQTSETHVGLVDEVEPGGRWSGSFVGLENPAPCLACAFRRRPTRTVPASSGALQPPRERPATRLTTVRTPGPPSHQRRGSLLSRACRAAGPVVGGADRQHTVIRGVSARVGASHRRVAEALTLALSLASAKAKVSHPNERAQRRAPDAIAPAGQVVVVVGAA